MRLLITTDTVGGVWTFTTQLTQQLLQRDNSVHLVSFGRKPSADQNAFILRSCDAYPDSFGYTASAIPLEWMQNNERCHSDGWGLLNCVIRSAARPELIVSNQFCFGALPTPIPRIVVAHSDVLSWAQACNPSALESTPWLSRYTSMVQSGLRAATAVVAPTAWMGKALTVNFALPDNYTVISNGANVSAPLSSPPQRKLQAITAGRLWDGAKGLETLQNLSSPIPLLLAGDNTLEPTQHQWVPTHLTNLGPLSQPDLHHHFRRSAIYLCTSHYEPFGLAPLEAALCGCALVLRDLPSLREIWADNALYFTDPTSLTHLLNTLKNNPSFLAGYQSRAQKRAQLFTPERMTDSYLALFESILDPQQARQHVA